MAACTHVLGIDEAGLGPLLGPLTIGYSLFALPQPLTPEGVLHLDLWQALGVGREPKERKHRPVVCDSKALYNPSRGLKPLEEELHCWLAAAGMEFADYAGFWAGLCPLAREKPAAYDWYADAPQPFPLHVEAARCRLRAQPVRRALESAGFALAELGVLPLLEGEFNRVVERENSKARAEFEAIARIMGSTWQRCRHLAVLCDRQGGREKYARTLKHHFPEADVRVFVESPKVSSYELVVPGVEGEPSLFVAFFEKGEGQFLPIALASMAAKYLREVMMHQFNAWFGRHDPALRPTAGYYSDGRRWLEDTAALRAALGIDESRLVRTR